MLEQSRNSRISEGSQARRCPLVGGAGQNHCREIAEETYTELGDCLSIARQMLHIDNEEQKLEIIQNGAFETFSERHPSERSSRILFIDEDVPYPTSITSSSASNLNLLKLA